MTTHIRVAPTPATRLDPRTMCGASSTSFVTRIRLSDHVTCQACRDLAEREGWPDRGAAGDAG